jgi:hypothetical protein
MVDTPQKRDRNRRKLEKRKEKELRKRDREQAKRERPPGMQAAPIEEPGSTIVDSAAQIPLGGQP